MSIENRITVLFVVVIMILFCGAVGVSSLLGSIQTAPPQKVVAVRDAADLGIKKGQELLVSFSLAGSSIPEWVWNSAKPVPTPTLNEAQKGQTEAAVAKVHATATRAAETKEALLHGTPTKSPVPSKTAVPTNTPVDTATPRPTSTPITPSPTARATSTPMKPCKGEYLASNGTKVPYNLEAGDGWTDLAVLNDGTKVQGSCPEGTFIPKEINRVVSGVLNAGRQAEDVAPFGIRLIAVIVILTLMAFIFFELRRLLVWIHDVLWDWVEYPILWFGGGLTIALRLVWILTGDSRWLELTPTIWNLAIGGMAIYLLVEVARKFGARRAADIVANGIDRQLTEAQQGRQQGQQGGQQGQPPP